MRSFAAQDDALSGAIHVLSAKIDNLAIEQRKTNDRVEVLRKCSSQF
jgi:hypothetical protein